MTAPLTLHRKPEPLSLCQHLQPTTCLFRALPAMKFLPAFRVMETRPGIIPSGVNDNQEEHRFRAPGVGYGVRYVGAVVGGITRSEFRELGS